MKIKFDSVKYFLLLLPMFEPQYFSEIPVIHMIYNIMQMFFIIYMIFHLLIYRRVSHIFISVCAFYIILVLSTWINQGEMGNSLSYVSPIIAMCFLIEIKPTKRDVIISCMSYILGIMCIVNLLTVFIFPYGMSVVAGEKYFFLGHNNAVARYIMPCIVLASFDSIQKKGKISVPMKIYCTALTLTLYLTESITGFIGCGLFCVYLWFLANRKLAKPMNFWLYLVVYLVASLAITVFNVQDKFQYLLSLAGKDGTLTSRTYIWNIAFEQVAKKPWIGVGYMQDYTTIFTLWAHNATSAHNYILDLLIRGGVFHFLFQLIIWIIIGKRLTSAKNEASEYAILSKKSQLLAFVFLCYFIMMLAEPFITSGVVPLFAIYMIAGTITDTDKNPKDGELSMVAA